MSARAFWSTMLVLLLKGCRVFAVLLVASQAHAIDKIMTDARYIFPGGIVDGGGQVTNVRAYGAVCNGSTDDSTAVSKALTAMGSTGVLMFPEGTCVLSSTITLTGVKGLRLMGAGPYVTILSYTGSGTLFDIGGGDSRHIIIEDMTLTATTSATALVTMTDADNGNRFHTFRNLRVVGGGASATTGFLLSGQASCNCFNTWDTVVFANLLTGIRLSGFANANAIRQAHFSLVGTGLSFVRTGTDTAGGVDNEIDRTEFDGSTALGIDLNESQAVRNVFTKIVTDNVTASAVIAAGRNTFIGSVLNPDPTGTGVAATRFLGTAYSGNDVIPDGDRMIIAVGVRSGSGGVSREAALSSADSAPHVLLRAASGSDGDEMRIQGATGSTSIVTFYAGGAEGERIQNGAVRSNSTDSPPTCAAGLDGFRYYDTSLGRECICSNNNAGAAYSWCPLNDPQTCSGGSSTSCG